MRRRDRQRLVDRWPVLLILAALAVGSVLLWRRWKQSGAWLRQDILNREGIARRAEIQQDLEAELSETREGHKAGTGQTPDPGRGLDAGPVPWRHDPCLHGRVDGHPGCSPLRQGPLRVINAILDAPGAVVTTSTRADNLAVTMKSACYRWPAGHRVRPARHVRIAVNPPLVTCTGMRESGHRYAPCPGHHCGHRDEGRERRVAEALADYPAVPSPRRRFVRGRGTGVSPLVLQSGLGTGGAGNPQPEGSGFGLAGRSDGHPRGRSKEYLQLVDWCLGCCRSAVLAEGALRLGSPGRIRGIRPQSGSSGTAARST
jgi:hypothetical protein